VVKGAGRWIDLGIFKLQPSEFAKIAYLLIISYWLSKHPVSLYKTKTFVVPFFLFIVPFALVLKQPDLSTALVFIAVTMVGFFFAGLTLTDMFLIVSPVLSVLFSHSQAIGFEILWGVLICAVVFALFRRKLPKILTGIILLANIFAGYASSMAWNMLEPHQQKRVNTFLDPMSDPLGDGYQVLQSLTAIGSGGLTGKGFGNGTQTNLAFLPEEHTDFIFSVLGEQFGFAGCAVVLVLYALFLWRATSICKQSSDPFVTLMVMGASTIFLFHILVNIAMTVGLMPVTGLPLPFLSYGGSFALTCMVLVGFLLCLRYQARRR
jgi:rod shape determining protein RodA